VEGLCGVWKVKNNPSKTYIRNIVKLREIYRNYRDSSKRPWKINVENRGMKHTHLDRWTCASGKWMIPRHKWSPRYRIAHVGRFEYGFVIKALENLWRKKNRGASLFFTFILFPSHFSLFIFSFFFFFPLVFFSSHHNFFSFFIFFFCSLELLRHNTYIAFVRDDVMTPPPSLDDARPEA
jgi:hypothetical protein